MGIFKRVSDVLRANISDLLNEAEDPEKMIKLYIADGKEQIKAMIEAVSSFIATEKTLQYQYDEIQKDIVHWQNHAEEAVKAGRDDLAAKAIEAQEKAENRLKGVIGPLSSAKEQTIKMKKELEAFKEKLEDTEANAEVLIARAKSAKALKNSAEAMAKISGGSSLDEMKSMEEKIIATESHAEAIKETSKSASQNLDDEFSALSSSNSTAAKLAALKQKIAKQK